MDSTLLACIARRALGEAMAAASVDSPFAIRREMEFARAFAARHRIHHIVLKADPLGSPQVARNDALRCYHCKKLIFSSIAAWAEKHGFPYIADGSNRSDEADYRPGKKALGELGVLSPLKEAGFTKDMIREACGALGLGVRYLSSNACLASRVPCGTPLTGKALEMIAEGEDFLEKNGFSPVRLRYHPPLARLELSPEGMARLMADDRMKRKITRRLKEIGFAFITLDMEGFRSGSMNILLKKK
jgi:uncharacterized protein